MCVYVWLGVSMYMWIQVPAEATEDRKSVTPGAGVTGGLWLLCLGDRGQTQVFSSNNTLRNYLSNP